MWFLIKGSFWFSLVLVALSFFGPPSTEDASAPRLELSDAFSAATQAYEYVSALCLEKPDVCEKGAETFTALQQGVVDGQCYGHRAREGAKVAYELLDRQFGGSGDIADEAAPPAELAAGEADDKPASDTVITGTVAPQPKHKPAL